MFKKEKLPKIYWKSSIAVVVFSYMMLPLGAVVSGDIWVNILLIAYFISFSILVIGVFIGIFLFFYLRKHHIKRRKIRWGIYINILAISIAFILGIMMNY